VPQPPSAADQSPGGGKQPQAEPFGFPPAGGGASQGKHLGPGEQVAGQGGPGTVPAAAAGHLPARHRARDVTVFRFANADGPYYAADPGFHHDGRFTALHLYPATPARRRSGYTDATRWLLNTLLRYKAARGLGPRDPFPAAAREDAAAVLGALEATAAGLDTGIDHAAATHIRENILPLATAYAAALDQAGYPPGLLFSRDFTIDTGQTSTRAAPKGCSAGSPPWTTSR
jgi:hypothetical protein